MNYLNFAHQLLMRRNPVIDRLFDTEKMIATGVAPCENLLKVKYLLDVIFDKRFSAMIDGD
jgi:hypothetical protein